MALLTPLRALRPAPAAAADVASVPYDVVNADEARTLAGPHPLSFLHVTRSEVDLPPGTDPYSGAVYARARQNLDALVAQGALVRDDAPALYVYRVRMGTHAQVGIAGGFSLDEYDRGLVRKHEKTRKDKEDDRTRHIVELRAQTGVVFLTYRRSAGVDEVAARVTASAPLYDFTAADGVAHTIWRVTGADMEALVRAFGAIPATYIADGHHRAASAARARQTLEASGEGTAEARAFVAVAFSDTQVQILPYNRVVKDLAGHTPASLLAAMRETITVGDGAPVPARARDVSMYLDGRWYAVTLPEVPAGTPRADALDVEVLQQTVLAPFLKVGDPRTDKRIDFVGGIRGPAELERLVQTGRAAVAFSLAPVSVQDLMAIADEGGIMPPKSTWFEPKLRDGLLVHMI
jgi:uncharacterized protein (DUF1015 family)